MDSTRDNHPSRGGFPSRSRGRGGRFRGGMSRGGFNNRSPDGPVVPSVRQVVVGSPVSIVLKIDQPTGREVQGLVGELLTNGDHPRGIKVRLQDGRVGRVQRMVSEETAKAGAEGLSGLGENGEPVRSSGIQLSSAIHTQANHPVQKYSDFRLDAPDEPPAQSLSLEDYVVVKTKGKGKKKGGKKAKDQAPDDQVKKGTTETSSPKQGDISKCPVCDNFEGDEAAVAHHVNDHFN